MAEKVGKSAKPERKGTTVSIPVDLWDFIDDLQWSERRKRSAILEDAVREYAVKRGFVETVEG